MTNFCAAAFSTFKNTERSSFIHFSFTFYRRTRQNHVASYLIGASRVYVTKLINTYNTKIKGGVLAFA